MANRNSHEDKQIIVRTQAYTEMWQSIHASQKSAQLH